MFHCHDGTYWTASVMYIVIVVFVRAFRHSHRNTTRIIPVNCLYCLLVRCSVDRTTEAAVDKTCSSDEFTCGDGTCIPLSQRCDFTEYHCADGTDEFDCRTLRSLGITFLLTVIWNFCSSSLRTFFAAFVKNMKLLQTLHCLYVFSCSNEASAQRVYSRWVQMRRWNVHWTEISLWPRISLSWWHRRVPLPYVTSKYGYLKQFAWPCWVSFSTTSRSERGFIDTSRIS